MHPWPERRVVQRREGRQEKGFEWHHPQLRDGELDECRADPTQEGLDCIIKNRSIKKRILLLGCQSNLMGESTCASLCVLPHGCRRVGDLTFPPANMTKSFLSKLFTLDGSCFSQRDNQSSVAGIDCVLVFLAVVLWLDARFSYIPFRKMRQLLNYRYLQWTR